MKRTILLSTAVFLFTMGMTAFAEIVRGINFDFVAVENPGNAPDTQVMATDGTMGYGSVGYTYHINKYEITNAQWNTFVSVSGAPNGNPIGAYDESAVHAGNQQPTNSISWYEAVQFCNWLTSGDKSKGAYIFSGNNAHPDDFMGIDRNTAKATYGTIYVLPTENEWYKAAYYKPDGSGYSLYANGSNTLPPADNGWNYYGGSYSAPWNVGTGAVEQNGTYDMMGNVWEWTETFTQGLNCVRRGGSFYDPGILDSPASSIRITFPQDGEIYDVGFRIVAVPEPCTLLLLGLGWVTYRKEIMGNR